MKKPSVHSSPNPKGGTLRLLLREPARATKKPKRQDVPYILVEQQLENVTKQSCDVRRGFLSQTLCSPERKLITYLISVEILSKFVRCPQFKAGKVCPPLFLS